MDWINEIAQIKKGHRKAALCVVVRTSGSTPRKIGAKMLVYETGMISGTIGGGNLEKKVIDQAVKQVEFNESKTFEHRLLQEHQMCCGGTVEVYIEPIQATSRLYIFGAGHTGKALIKLTSRFDFETTIIDDRKEYLDSITELNSKSMLIDFKQGLAHLNFDQNTFIVILTYDHALDRKILAHCLKQPRAYLGMIGSKRKIALTKKMFLKNELATEQELESVDMPMGININAEGPHEIAVSILAKLIEVKNGKKSSHSNRSISGDWEGDCETLGEGELHHNSR
jgi:xanthine dehydrogenase accessory factor